MRFFMQWLHFPIEKEPLARPSTSTEHAPGRMSLSSDASGQPSRSFLRDVASGREHAHRRPSCHQGSITLVLSAILISLSCATETAAMPVSDTQSVSSNSGMTLRDERLTRPSTGRIDRALLTPRFDTYRLPESPMMALEVFKYSAARPPRPCILLVYGLLICHWREHRVAKPPPPVPAFVVGSVPGNVLT